MKKLIMCLMLILAGCSGEKAKTVQELYDVTVACKKEAQQGRDEKDADKAENAAENAEEIAEKAEERLKEQKVISESDKETLNKILVTANETKHIAELAAEDEELSDLLSSWKAKAYRKTRLLTIKGVFLGLALAVDQAEKKGIDALPAKVQESAIFGASLVYDYTGKGKLKNGDPDWKEIAKVLREFSTTPPAELPAVFAVVYTAANQKSIGLYEIELLDPEKISDNDRKLWCKLTRSIILSMNGFTNLAVESMEQTVKEFEEHALLKGINQDESVSTEEQAQILLSCMHLAIGYLHFEKGKHKEADKEVVRAMKAWPNNPLTVFLTGEILLENGKKDEAVESLKKAAAQVEAEWLAEIIAQRAKEIRDGKGKDESLLYNSKVLGGIILTVLIEKAKKTDIKGPFADWLQIIQNFSDKLGISFTPSKNGNDKSKSQKNLTHFHEGNFGVHFSHTNAISTLYNPHGGADRVALTHKGRPIGGLIIRSSPPTDNIDDFISSGKEHFKSSYGASTVDYSLYENPHHYKFHYLKAAIKANDIDYVIENFIFLPDYKEDDSQSIADSFINKLSGAYTFEFIYPKPIMND